MSMTGMDYYSAMLITSEICDIARFCTPKKLVSWSCLCPTLYQSGDSLYHGKIKHDGNRNVQTVMIQAAKTAARTDERMRTFYTLLAKRHEHNVSITHVANKMMTIIWLHACAKKTIQREKRRYVQEKA